MVRPSEIVSVPVAPCQEAGLLVSGSQLWGSPDLSARLKTSVGEAFGPPATLSASQARAWGISVILRAKESAERENPSLPGFKGCPLDSPRHP